MYTLNMTIIHLQLIANWDLGQRDLAMQRVVQIQLKHWIVGLFKKQLVEENSVTMKLKRRSIVDFLLVPVSLLYFLKYKVWQIDNEVMFRVFIVTLSLIAIFQLIANWGLG